MPKNTMDDLRNHLFATLEALRDEDAPMEIKRAKAVCEVADRLIETAKIEVNLLDVVGQVGASSNRFLSLEPAPESERPRLVAKLPS